MKKVKWYAIYDGSYSYITNTPTNFDLIDSEEFDTFTAAKNHLINTLSERIDELAAGRRGIRELRKSEFKGEAK